MTAPRNRGRLSLNKDTIAEMLSKAGLTWTIHEPFAHIFPFQIEKLQLLASPGSLYPRLLVEPFYVGYGCF